MTKTKAVNANELTMLMESLGIEFSAVGAAPDGKCSFMSLRKIEEGGIYYLVSGITSAPPIKRSIILCPSEFEAIPTNLVLRVENPQLAFYQLMNALMEGAEGAQGIHPTAVIGLDCQIDPSANIGPYCVLENCSIGANVKLHSHVVVMSGTTIEDDVTIEPHSTIGATGVAWIWDPATGQRVMQPQTGYTVVGKGTFLGSDVSVVRGSVNETTSIGEGCVIAHGSKIGHGSQVGNECHFANNVSIAGNVILGNQCFLGSGSTVRPQVRLATQTVVGSGAVVTKHSETAGRLLIGMPAKDTKSAYERLSGVPLQKTKEEAS